MAKNPRRFPISLSLLPEVRLSLFGLVRGRTKTGMAEQLILEAVLGKLNWEAVQKHLRQEAALRRIPVEELIKERLRQDGLDKILDLDEIDWSEILDSPEELEFPQPEE